MTHVCLHLEHSSNCERAVSIVDGGSANLHALHGLLGVWGAGGMFHTALFAVPLARVPCLGICAAASEIDRTPGCVSDATTVPRRGGGPLSRRSSIDHTAIPPDPTACLLHAPCGEQTPNPVLELEYLRPVNSNGRRLDRSIILHFLSMGEFVDAVLQDDFELGVSFASRIYLFLSQVYQVYRYFFGWLLVYSAHPYPSCQPIAPFVTGRFV